MLERLRTLVISPRCFRGLYFWGIAVHYGRRPHRWSMSASLPVVFRRAPTGLTSDRWLHVLVARA